MVFRPTFSFVSCDPQVPGGPARLTLKLNGSPGSMLELVLCWAQFWRKGRPFCCPGSEHPRAGRGTKRCLIWGSVREFR